MARIISFEGRQISVPDDATDDEVAGILGGAAAPAETAPTSFSLGAQKGFGNVAANIGGALKSGGEAIGLPMEKIAGFLNDNFAPPDAAHTLDEVRNPQNYAKSNPEGFQPSAWGKLLGEIVGTAPTAPLAGIPFIGPAVAGAAGGALATDPSAGESYAVNTGLGAAGGQVMRGLGGLVSRLGTTAEKAPTVDALKTAAQDAYGAFDNAGHVVAASAYNDLVTGLANTLANEGIDKTLHPAATAAFDRLAKEGGNNVTFKGMDILRRVANDGITAAQANPADQRVGYLVRNGIDDFMAGLKPSDVIPGMGTGEPGAAVAALNDGRALWSRAAQAETIQDAIDKAGIKASGYSQSGEENALRAQFRQLALNDGETARMAPDVQEAVQAVAKGTPGGNVARTFGKLAPRGPVSTLGAIGTGMATGTGPLPLLVGEASKYLATRGARKAAQRALDTAALGRAPAVTTNPGATALGDLFRQLSGVGGTLAGGSK